MNRREFIVGTTGAAMAVAAGTSAAAPRRGLKKAVNLNMANVGKTVAEKFKAIKDAGFDGVEVDAPNSMNRDEVLKARDDSGLTIHGVVDSVHWGAPLSDAQKEVREKGLAGLIAAIEECKAYGGTNVLLVPAVVNKNVSYLEAYERSQAEIRKAIPKAKELGITIAIENVWNHFLLSPLEMERYIDGFESESVVSYFDIGNIITFGWPEQWIRILNKRIRRLHIKEYSRKKRDEKGLWKGFDVELNEGDNDWPAVRKALTEIGYDGWCTAEVNGGDAKRLADIKERMDKALDG